MGYLELFTGKSYFQILNNNVMYSSISITIMFILSYIRRWFLRQNVTFFNLQMV